MAKAQMKEEEKQIIQSIKSIWPGFDVSEKNLRELSSEFITRFFRTYFNDLKTECASMFDENFEALGDIMQYCPVDLDHDEFLYVYIKDILDKIGMQYISLIDILRPQNRTKTAIRVAVNFLVYIKQEVPYGREVLREIVTASRALEQLMVDRASLKEDISKTSEQIGIAKEELEDVKIEYQKQLKIQEELRAEDPEMEKLRREIEDLEEADRQQRQDLHILEREELSLKAQVVTEDEYNLLTARIAELTASIEENDEATGQIDKIMETKCKDKDYLHSISALLSSVDMNSWLSIEKIDELGKAIKMAENLHNPATLQYLKTIKNIEDELSDLHKMLNSEQKSHENFGHVHDQKYTQLLLDQQAECEHLDKLNKEYTKARKEYNACKDKCLETEGEIKEIIEYNSKMYEHFLDNYRVLATEFDKRVKLLEL